MIIFIKAHDTSWRRYNSGAWNGCGLYAFIRVVEHTLFLRERGHLYETFKASWFYNSLSSFPYRSRASPNFDTRFPPLAETFRRHVHKIISRGKSCFHACPPPFHFTRLSSVASTLLSNSSVEFSPLNSRFSPSTRLRSSRILSFPRYRPRQEGSVIRTDSEEARSKLGRSNDD